MKKGRHTEAEIIKAVNKLGKGVSADSVCMIQVMLPKTVGGILKKERKID